MKIIAVNSTMCSAHSRTYKADFDGDSIAGTSYVLVKDAKGNIKLKQIKDV